MWEIEEQIRRLLESTRTTTKALAERMCEEHDVKVTGSYIRHCLMDRQDTPKGRQVLMMAHQVLTEIQEEQNQEREKALKRAEKALAKAGQLAQC